jgi:serine/threonine protein kinase
VRIADFGHCAVGQSVTLTGEWSSVSSHYLAPECYHRRCSLKSDVFSFGLILFEFLTGLPAFQKKLSQHAIGKLIALENDRPDIPGEFLMIDLRLSKFWMIWKR